MNDIYNDTHSSQTIIERPTTEVEPSTRESIHSTLSMLFHDGDTIMVSRTLANSDKFLKQTFDSIEKAAKFAEAQDRDQDVTNIYVNLQQLKPGATTDKRTDVAAYVRFLVDIDRKVKSVDGKRVMASDDERDALRKVATEANRWVSRILRCDPLVADSGNGFHLCWFLIPNAFDSAIAPSQENRDLYRECLSAIKQRFDNAEVEIDASLSEPEQIIRLWGTHNRRSPETEGRPHRQSVILEQPRGTASLAQLGLLACEYKPPASNAPVSRVPARAAKATGEAPSLHPDFDESAWWEHYERAFHTVGERDGWQVTDICPLYFEGEGTGCRHTGSIYTGFRFDRGQAEFHCFSDEDLDGIPHCDLSFAAVMKIVHRNYPPYRGTIWDWPDDDLSEFVFADKPTHEPEQVSAQHEPNEVIRVDNQGNTYVEGANRERIERKFEELEPRKAIDLTAVEAGRVELIKGEKDGAVVQVTGIYASTIVPEPMNWVWANRIPLGIICWLLGKPGQAKSLASIEIVACVTTGRDWPDGEENTLGPKRVLMYCPEDSMSKVVIPRLIAAGADLDKITILDNKSFRKITGDKKTSRSIAMDKDIPLLSHLIKKKFPDIALIVCDPITGIWGSKKTNIDDEMREITNQLIELCELRNVTFLGVAHTNKRTEASAIHQIQGCSSIAGCAKAAFMFSHDPDSEDKHDHLMTLIKGNYTGVDSGLKFKSVGTEITSSGESIETVKLEFGMVTDMTADDVLDKQKDKNKDENKKLKKVEQAKELIASQLQCGPKLAREMYELGLKEGISDETMKNAYPKLGVRPYKETDGWYWALPGHRLSEPGASGTSQRGVKLEDVTEL